MTGQRLVYVQPGEVRWSQQPCIFKTVLGSCVSVCLWDASHNIGGLTHFILPYAKDADDSARFGDIAIPLLRARLLACGGTRPVAKLFGGASVLDSGAGLSIARTSSAGVAMGGLSIGDSNVHAALALLRAEGIEVVAKRTGGRHGLVIKFSTLDGSVEVREIRRPLGAVARPPG